MPTQVNNQRIAKNTPLLYGRMLLIMAVSLYTSRVVLNTLGVEDYGIYNVVGGIVTIFAYFNETMKELFRAKLSIKQEEYNNHS